MDYSQIITIEPGKMGGKPCIRGLRITVYDVLDYLASGMTEDEILHDFSDLTREDKKKLAAAFGQYVPNKSLNVDQQIALVREQLTPTYGPGFDFYATGLKERWKPDGGDEASSSLHGRATRRRQ